MCASSPFTDQQEVWSTCSVIGSDSLKLKAKPQRWTAEEDKLLVAAVNTRGARHWKTIASLVPGRDDAQCLQRWSKTLKPGITKGRWAEWEDATLLRLVKQLGPCWGRIAEEIDGRTSKQVRQRWCFQLDPSLKHGAFNQEEDEQLLELYEKYGSRWSRISQEMVGRTADAVKVRHKSLQKQQQRAKELGLNTPLVQVVGQKRDSTNPSSQHSLARPSKEQRLGLKIRTGRGCTAKELSQMVKKLVQQGRDCGYLAVRNQLQSHNHLNRPLSPAEKELVSTVLIQHQASAHQQRQQWQHRHKPEKEQQKQEDQHLQQRQPPQEKQLLGSKSSVVEKADQAMRDSISSMLARFSEASCRLSELSLLEADSVATTSNAKPTANALQQTTTLWSQLSQQQQATAARDSIGPLVNMKNKEKMMDLRDSIGSLCGVSTCSYNYTNDARNSIRDSRDSISSMLSRCGSIGSARDSISSLLGPFTAGYTLATGVEHH